MKIDRSKRPQIFRTSLLLLTSLVMSSCVTGPDGPDMGGIYSVLAQSEDPYRNPVILIPGTMGSRLVDPDERRRNALDHLQKSLHRDRQFTAALGCTCLTTQRCGAIPDGWRRHTHRRGGFRQSANRKNKGEGATSWRRTCLAQ